MKRSKSCPKYYSSLVPQISTQIAQNLAIMSPTQIWIDTKKA